MSWLILRGKDKKVFGRTRLHPDEQVEVAQFRVLERLRKRSAATWEITEAKGTAKR